MPKKKLKWTDSEDIVFQLIDKYPSTDPMRLSLSEIAKRTTALPSFSEAAKPDSEALESIQKSWFEERADMEDELGPLEQDIKGEEGLDEDEYRDDRMIDDEKSLVGLEETEKEEDDDDDGLGEGFHEEEVEDER